MKPQQKKLGKAINWMVCSSCGYRESDDSTDANEILDIFVTDDGANFEDVYGEYVAGKIEETDWDGVRYNPLFQDESGRF